MRENGNLLLSTLAESFPGRHQPGIMIARVATDFDHLMLLAEKPFNHLQTEATGMHDPKSGICRSQSRGGEATAEFVRPKQTRGGNGHPPSPGSRRHSLPGRQHRPNADPRFKRKADEGDSFLAGHLKDRFPDAGESVDMLVGIEVRNGQTGAADFVNLRSKFLRQLLLATPS